MEPSAITAFVRSPENFWIILGLGIFLIIDGVGLWYLLAKNYLNTGNKKTKFSHQLLLLSAVLTAAMGMFIIAVNLYMHYS